LIVGLSGTLGLAQAPAPAPKPAAPDPIAPLVARLDLERYKATIKGLTQFGDRKQGTARNRAANDWIEAQLKSYGCTNTERLKYDYQPPATPPGGGRGRGPADPNMGPGGSRRRGYRIPESVNNDPLKQPDLKLRELNTPPSEPGPRDEVYCTKIGTTHPDEMYIVAAHMDGIGWGEAANDDGSGTALVMELARILSAPDVHTDRSIRFALWNNEETGLSGARAYVEQRKALQGIESPKGSGKYPEPKWLGMIQHDMMMFDHGMPLADGTIPKKQRPEADINIEYQWTAKLADAAMALSQKFLLANDKYADKYPATVGPHMTNTDSTPFMDLTPSISLRENERGSQLGNGWDPQHHQPTDLYSTYDDDDFRLGLNAAQTTLGAIAQLAGVTVDGYGPDAPRIVQPGAPGKSGTMLTPETAAIKSRAPSEADVSFMQGMIMHHNQAVEMVALMSARSKNKDLLTLGKRISISQTDEMKFMKQWLEERGKPTSMPGHMDTAGMDHSAMAGMDRSAMAGPDHSGMDHSKMAGMDHGSQEMMMPGMLTPEQMKALAAAKGTKFDHLFLTGMIQHHNGALTMVQDLFGTAGAGQDAVLFDFATDVDNTQRAEIRIMQGMLAKGMPAKEKK
jgi:uncharacterized protein (DUF305 family)